MNLATMNMLEIIGLAFLIWLGLIIFIVVTCILYKYSAKIHQVIETITGSFFHEDQEEFDPEWMDYNSWKELTP